MRGLGRNDDLDRILHSAYGEPPRGLVDRLARSVPGRGGLARRSLALAVSFSAVVVAALAAVGGVGYAASTVGDVARQVAHPAAVLGHKVVLTIDGRSAAKGEYGQSDNAQAKELPKSDTTQTLTAGTASVSIPPAAATAIVDAAGGKAGVNIDPTPPQAGTAIAAVGIVVTNKDGVVIHPTLAATAPPLDITVTVSGQPSATAPCIDRGDGRGCVATVPVTPPISTCSQLPASGDGYYYDASDSTKLHFVTCHLTVFAVVNKADLKVSKTGHPLAPANSGKFGDAALYSTDKAKLTQSGSAKTVTLKKGGKAVSFTFVVDQQVSAYIQLYKGGKKVPIALKGSMIRGTTLAKGKNVPTLHVAVLRPGTLAMRLRSATGFQSGASYRVRVAVLNIDGSSTVLFIPFKG